VHGETIARDLLSHYYDLNAVNRGSTPVTVPNQNKYNSLFLISRSQHISTLPHHYKYTRCIHITFTDSRIRPHNSNQLQNHEAILTTRKVISGNSKTVKMIEDDAYRSSSQYRYWSYTKESLQEIRQNTNDLASERVRAAFRRVQASKSPSHRNGDSANGSSSEPGGAKTLSDADVQTLTADEELKIVEWGCQKIMDMGEAMTPRVPSAVVVCFSPLGILRPR